MSYFIIQAENRKFQSYYVGKKKKYLHKEEIQKDDCWKRESAALSRMREYASMNLKNLNSLAVTEVFLK